jgi:hypothetical protein
MNRYFKTEVGFAVVPEGVETLQECGFVGR